MAPWDELRYFDLPLVQQFTSTTDSRTAVAQADPQRAWLMFTLGGTSGQVNVMLTAGVANTGLVVTTTGVPLIFRARDDPGICQAAWFASIPAGANLTVWSVRLREWPKSNAVQRVGAPLPWERLVRPQWPAGAGNGQNPPG